MRTTLSKTCAKRTTPPQPPEQNITAWARDLVARPARYGASERERSIVAFLLAEAVTR
ncbi:MAG: hypothetical protein ABW046_20790 [Actinoplanes sp.]